MLRATVFVMEYFSTLDAGFLKVEDWDSRLSYADDLVFGIIADYDAAPEVGELAGGITRAVGRLAALSVAPRVSTAGANVARWLMIAFAPPRAGSF